MMQFSTIHTTAGLAAMSAAEASGTPINLTHMAVGDGSGNPVTPAEGQTGLVRELYRAAINRVYKPDPTGQPTKYAVELVIPASEGGFVLREVGVFDAEGTLFVVGNLPETYKPEASEGAFSDTVVRVEFIATNANVVTIQLDPNVTVATQTWVTNNITAAMLIPGGTTGQVLTKDSNTDGDYVWEDPTDANVVVNTIEEYQTLADSQTVVTLTTVNTVGLAVYINGLRLPQDGSPEGWAPDGADSSKLTLGQSYPAGSELIAVQNEPAAGFPDALLTGQNLADVPDKALARQNLDIYSRAQTDQKAPPGLVGHFARQSAPVGWLKANGAEISRLTYSSLFNAIGTAFGAGNGVDTFNLPDLRGEFMRGWDDGRGIDGGRGFASAQGDQFKSHGHTGATNTAGAHSHNRPATSGDGNAANSNAVGGPASNTQVASSVAGAHSHTLSINPSGGAETRPRNVALLACIKF